MFILEKAFGCNFTDKGWEIKVVSFYTVDTGECLFASGICFRTISTIVWYEIFFILVVRRGPMSKVIQLGVMSKTYAQKVKVRR
jgi:hypothetical protein